MNCNHQLEFLLKVDKITILLKIKKRRLSLLGHLHKDPLTVCQNFDFSFTHLFFAVSHIYYVDSFRQFLCHQLLTSVLQFPKMILNSPSVILSSLRASSTESINTLILLIFSDTLNHFLTALKPTQHWKYGYNYGLDWLLFHYFVVSLS